MRRILTSAATILTLVGCATINPPTAEQLEKADYGREITTTEFNQIAQTRLADILLDPSSLMYYGATATKKHWATDRTGTNYFGYFGCYDYNAKNRMGGYGGKERECLLVRNGAVLQRYFVKFINNGEPYFTPALLTIDRRITSSDLAPQSNSATAPAAENKFEQITGKKFDPAKVDVLRPGVSTVSDAKKIIGPTSSESSYANGNTLLQWQFISATTNGSNGAHVAILFGPDQKMIRVTHKFVQ